MTEAWSGILTLGETFGGGNVTRYLYSSSGPDKDDPVKFCYIRNLGTTAGQEARVTLNGANFLLVIPPNGSIAFRGDGTNLLLKDVKAKRKTNDTSIEYVIAN